MASATVLEKARLAVRAWFAKRMPPHMEFHDLDHTLGVARTAVAIGRASRVPEDDLRLLEIAALFHDTGYAVDPSDHERHSADIAERFLRAHGVNDRVTARIRALILSTRKDATPRSLLQRVLRDADSAKAGQADFAARSERLRREIGALHGRKPGPDQWRTENLAYLRSHRFHTRYAKERFGTQKRLNIAALEKKPPKGTTNKDRFFERDLSWLAFNERVLQEAMDPSVPLLERIKFLGIYSNNLDEFYRVRVASLRSLGQLKKSQRTALELPPQKLVERINRKALGQQRRLGRLLRGTLLPALAKKGIRILGPDQLDKEQRAHVKAYFTEHVAPLLFTTSVRAGNAPFIEDRKLYFVCRLRDKGPRKQRLVLVNIPSDELGRFVVLPSAKGRTDLIYLDDVIRLCLDRYFNGPSVQDCHAIKLSRDAELYLDEEFSGNVKDKVKRSLKKRRSGVPARFLFDSGMPPRTLRALRTLLGLSKQDLVAGGRYHNLSDLMKLPVEGHAELRERPEPPLPHPQWTKGAAFYRSLARKDQLWHFPYHDFGMFTAWLRHAASDPAVERIAITLYRVAEGSEVCGALLEALKRGKQVLVFVEVQARFDEGSNLVWGERLEQAGARVIYSYEGLKVHAKLCLVERRSARGLERFAYLGTGNFHERTARLYTDTALVTADPALTNEVADVFRHLGDQRHKPETALLMLAPHDLRHKLEALVDAEIERARLGRPASITLKMNSLEDRPLISKLYDASRSGVEVRLIVRGICCLVPGVAGMSRNIKAVSIVDRYLEHTRVYVFGNDGDPLVYLASADWMGRNMDRRIEVAFPVRDPDLRQEMLDMLTIQLQDRRKARRINARQTNPYVKAVALEPRIRAQEEFRRYLAKALEQG
jgi:polyphosphate kinase